MLGLDYKLGVGAGVILLKMFGHFEIVSSKVTRSFIIFQILGKLWSPSFEKCKKHWKNCLLFITLKMTTKALGTRDFLTCDFSQTFRVVKKTNLRYFRLEAKNKKSKTTLLSQLLKLWIVISKVYNQHPTDIMRSVITLFYWVLAIKETWLSCNHVCIIQGLFISNIFLITWNLTQHKELIVS